jgi:hypothetical protein
MFGGVDWCVWGGMKQLTLATVGFERYAKTTRRAAFLRARARHLLRNCPELGAQVRTGDCAAPTAAVLARATDGTWTRWRSVTYVSGPHNRLTGGAGVIRTLGPSRKRWGPLAERERSQRRRTKR